MFYQNLVEVLMPDVLRPIPGEYLLYVSSVVWACCNARNESYMKMFTYFY